MATKADTLTAARRPAPVPEGGVVPDDTAGALADDLGQGSGAVTERDATS